LAEHDFRRIRGGRRVEASIDGGRAVVTLIYKDRRSVSYTSDSRPLPHRFPAEPTMEALLDWGQAQLEEESGSDV
jgi:hypothetical protein